MRGSVSMVVIALTVCLSGIAYGNSSPAHNKTPHTFSALPHSQIPGLVKKAGLWDKPNQACITKCETFIQKGCFKTLSEKNPTADPASIQEQCDDKFSLCLYDCMCDTCDENQIIIKQP